MLPNFLPKPILLDQYYQLDLSDLSDRSVLLGQLDQYFLLSLTNQSDLVVLLHLVVS